MICTPARCAQYALSPVPIDPTRAPAEIPVLCRPTATSHGSYGRFARVSLKSRVTGQAIARTKARTTTGAVRFRSASALLAENRALGRTHASSITANGLTYRCSTRTSAYIVSAASEGSQTRLIRLAPQSHFPAFPTCTISARNTAYRAPLLENSFKYEFALRNKTHSCPFHEKCGRIPSYQ